MNDLIVYILKSSACLFFFYSLYWLFLKGETYFLLNRIYLIASVFTSLIIPLLRIPLPFVRSAPDPSMLRYGEVMASNPARFGLGEIVLLVYLTGVLFFLFRFGYKITRLFTVIKQKGIRRHGGLKIVFVDTDLAPSSFFHYIFLNPSNISQSDFSRIIAHELVHIRQFHSIDIILLELVTIFQWFNPFVWPYRESLKETHEYLADKAVVAQGCSRAQYQLLILEQHVGGRLFEFVNNFRNSQIKRRLTMMSRKESREWSKLKLMFIIPMALILIWVFADTKPVDKTEKSEKVKSAETTTTQVKKEEKAELSEEKIKAMIDDLKKKYSQTDDPDEKKKIKEKATYLMGMLEEEYAQDESAHKAKEEEMKKKEIEHKLQELKAKYAETDDPDEKKKIKEKATYLMQMLETEETSSEYSEEELAKIKELKMEIEKTEDPEKKKKLEELLKMKLEELKKKEKK